MYPVLDSNLTEAGIYVRIFQPELRKTHIYQHVMNPIRSVDLILKVLISYLCSEYILCTCRGSDLVNTDCRSETHTARSRTRLRCYFCV